MWLPLLCRNSEAIRKVQHGLTGGRMAGWQADEIHVNFNSFKNLLYIDQNV